MVVKVVSSLEEFKQIIDGDKPAIFDFWATWCGPCKIISPVFEKLSEAAEGKVDFYKVDVDEAQEIAQEVGVRAMPTFAAFHKGQKVKEVVGANPPALQALVDSAKQLA
ncbi:thioredoxin [Polyporus arcularius HHB13444]|uniref:Thioredoxin n=1 Tax=Polyporus arcularius HHB13444 TaxID=1314778 RepID=A0A5C3PNK1_9APHY|nr:thioredoxin [Polyporus arcularius HHB13444]